MSHLMGFQKGSRRGWKNRSSSHWNLVIWWPDPRVIPWCLLMSFSSVQGDSLADSCWVAAKSWRVIQATSGNSHHELGNSGSSSWGDELFLGKLGRDDGFFYVLRLLRLKDHVIMLISLALVSTNGEDFWCWLMLAIPLLEQVEAVVLYIQANLMKFLKNESESTIFATMRIQ